MYITCHNRYSFRMDSAKIPEIKQKRIITQSRVETQNTYASSNRWTRNASLASCKARIAELCQRSPASPYSRPASVIMSSAISRTCQLTVSETAQQGGARSYHARKGELAQEQVRALLIPPDFT